MEAAGYCDKCLEGSILAGTPKGSMVKLGELDAYMTPTPEGAHPTKVIFLVYDIFGLGIDNSKIVADQLSTLTKTIVYVPDVLEGDWMAPDALSLPEQPMANKSLFSKVGIYASMISSVVTSGAIKFMIRNKEPVITPRSIAFAKALKSEKGFQRIGVIGYCFGGIQAIMLSGTDVVDVAVVVHPGKVSKEALEKIHIPTSFGLAEEDMGFNDSMVRLTKEVVEPKSNSFATEFVVYPGTVHGFGLRPNLNFPDVKKGFEGVIVQGANWFNKYL